MNSQLVLVFDGTISNESALLCNARDLHKFLEVGRDFSNWIRERISEYGFIANLDYTEFSPNSAKTGGRRRKEYHLTLDTAKELAMVERNEKGRQVRRYFIDCEKQLRRETMEQPEVHWSQPTQAEIDAHYAIAAHQQAQHIRNIWDKELAPLLKAIKSPILGRLNGRIIEIQITTNRVKESLAANLPDGAVPRLS
ncbi:antA/AntB antirepressor family protein [Serratia sp. CY76391]|uniref:antA/AntB antirepressor family protein n=1 Tax=Serratia sp. CY76391 TaxID=3383681 RepID=UPI003FA0E9C0